MSVRVMTWVFEQSRSKKNARLVLLAIADCANDEGRQAYPSMAKLCQKTGLSERAVTGLVADLERLGELEVKRNAGPKGCNLYRVVMTPAGSAPPQDLHPAGSAGVKKPQVKADDPAESAPPADPAPPQKTTADPAESAPGTVREPSKTSSSKKSSTTTRTRGKTKIPDDFQVTAEMIAWARQHTPLVGRAETDTFKDHFRGSGVTKADWVATWRNWMRRAQGDAERYAARANGRSTPSRQLIEHNGLLLKPETAADLDRRRRFEDMDAQQQLAIGGAR